MREVCFILVGDKILRVYFGSEASIPDQRERWEAIWAHRHEITEIAHTHPGNFLDFSTEDLTTMEAVEAGTGKQFTWSVVTRTGYRARKGRADIPPTEAPWWLSLIRQLSYGAQRDKHESLTDAKRARRSAPADGVGARTTTSASHASSAEGGACAPSVRNSRTNKPRRKGATK